MVRGVAQLTAVVLAAVLLSPGAELVADRPSEPVVDSNASDYDWKLPAGFPVPRVPADNPMTADKVELGKLLYFDKRLSKDGTVSCATCHDPQKGWAERTPTSTGIKSQVGGRNAPTVINSAYMDAMFWDGRMKTLEEQALGPIENPIEMGHKLDDVVADLHGQARIVATKISPETSLDHLSHALPSVSRCKPAIFFRFRSRNR